MSNQRKVERGSPPVGAKVRGNSTHDRNSKPARRGRDRARYNAPPSPPASKRRTFCRPFSLQRARSVESVEESRACAVAASVSRPRWLGPPRPRLPTSARDSHKSPRQPQAWRLDDRPARSLQTVMDKEGQAHRYRGASRRSLFRSLDFHDTFEYAGVPCLTSVRPGSGSARQKRADPRHWSFGQGENSQAHPPDFSSLDSSRRAGRTGAPARGRLDGGE